MIPKVSRGVRVLPPKKKESVPEEHDKLQLDAREIGKGWSDSRWMHTRRTYKGTSVSACENDNVQGLFLLFYE
jgi:hypothetical protein